MRVIRQIKGVDSNKLQPIIRHHNDKDFRVMSTSDIEPLDYRAIIFKIPPQRLKQNRNKEVDYSLNINDSGDIMDDDDEDEDDRNS